MRTTTVNGELYQRALLEQSDVHVGQLVQWREGRSAYRIVAFDEGDAVLRNMRRLDLITAVPMGKICKEYVRLDPLPSAI